jgi:hypothetical protein
VTGALASARTQYRLSTSSPIVVADPSSANIDCPGFRIRVEYPNRLFTITGRLGSWLFSDFVCHHPASWTVVVASSASSVLIVRVPL